MTPPLPRTKAEEDAKKSKEETELAASNFSPERLDNSARLCLHLKHDCVCILCFHLKERFKEREALNEKQAIAKRRIEELKLLEGIYGFECSPLKNACKLTAYAMRFSSTYFFRRKHGSTMC